MDANTPYLELTWVEHHAGDIRTWTPFYLLWLLHHDLLSAARLGRGITSLATDSSPAARAAVARVAAHYEALDTVVQAMHEVYRHDHIASIAHQGRVPTEEETQRSHQIMQELWTVFLTHVPAIGQEHEAFAVGNYHFDNELHTAVFTVVTQARTLIVLMRYLELWVSAHPPA